MVKHGDPYQAETIAATERLRELLDVAPDRIKVAYQSKFGPFPWLKPYLRETLIEEAQQGSQRVLLVAPAFVTDCLETLEENGIGNAQIFKDHGGDRLDLLPALNAAPSFAQFLAHLAVQEAE